MALDTLTASPPAEAAPTPTPSLLSVDDFASQIKEKYPQYKDVDNATLSKAIVEKYPVYADKVDLTPPKEQPPAPAEAYQSANPFGAVTAPERTPETPANPQQQSAGDEFTKEQQARASAFQQAQKDAIANGYGSDVDRYAKDKGIQVKPLLETPAQYAEEKTGISRSPGFLETAKKGISNVVGDLKRGEIGSAIGEVATTPLESVGKSSAGVVISDALTALQNVTTMPLVSLIRGTTQSQELGKQEQETESNLQANKMVADAKAKQDAGQALTPDEDKAVQADKFSSKLKVAWGNLTEHPSTAAKELLLGALEDAPTYILASEVGGGVLDAAKAIIKTGSQAERLAALTAKVAAANPEDVDAAGAAIHTANAAAQEQAVNATKEALVKPSLASKVGRETGVNAVAAPVAGEEQQSETGGKYDAAQLAQDLVAGSALAAGGSLFHALTEARPLTSDEFDELQKAVNVAGLENHPAVKELLPTLLETARNKEFTDNGGKITPSAERPQRSAEEARAAYGEDMVPEGSGPLDVPGKTTVASPTATPEITLFGGADPSTVKEEVSHFMQTLVQRRADQGDPKFADLQNKINVWEQAVRNHAAELSKSGEPVSLPKGDELFAQAYVAHRGFADQAHPDVARVKIPDNILAEFDKLMGQYKDIGHEQPVRDITGLDEEGKPMLGQHPAERGDAPSTPINRNPELDLPARTTPEGIKGAVPNSAGRWPLPDENPIQTHINQNPISTQLAAAKELPSHLAAAVPAVRSLRTAARIKDVLAHANRLEADPLAKEFLPARLQGITDARRNSPSMRSDFEDVRQANLDVARQMKAEPEKYFVDPQYTNSPAGKSDITPIETRTKNESLRTKSPQEESVPEKDFTTKASDKLEKGLAKESAAQPDFTVRQSGEAVPNHSRLPSPERVARMDEKYGEDSPYTRYQLRPPGGWKKAARIEDAQEKATELRPVATGETPRPPESIVTPPKENETPEELGKRRAEELKPAITNTIDEIKHFNPKDLGTKGTPGNETHGAPGAFTEFMRYTDSPDVLAALAGGKDGTFHTYMWTNPAKGDSYGIGVRRAAQAPLDQHFKDAGMGPSATIAWRRSPVKVTLADGRALTVKRSELVDLYNSASNAGTRRLILKNGIIPKRLKGGKPIEVTEADLHTLFDAMSPFDRKTANLMMEINRDQIKPELNRVSRIKDGAEHFNIENHWPRTVDRDQVQHEIKDMRDVYGQRQLEDEGFIKPREEHGHPIIFGDALDKFDNYLHKAAKYIGLAIPVRDALMVLGHPDVGKALLSSMGPRFRNQMMKYLNDISAMNPPDKNILDKAIQWLGRNAAVEALGFRPTTFIKTWLGSALNMTTQMTPRENASFAKSHAWVLAHEIAAEKLFKEQIAPHSPYTADRYDPRQTQRILGYLGEADNLATNKAVQYYKSAQDVAIRPHNFVEKQSAIAHWRMQNELHPERTPAEKAWELEKAIRRSQNTVSQLDMSAFGRATSKNSWMKLGFMFTSPLQKSRDLLRMGLMDFQRSKKTPEDIAKFASTYAAVMTAMVAVPAALRPLTSAIYNGFQTPKKQKDAGDYVTESLIDALDIGQPALGQVMRAAYEYWKNPSSHSLAHSNVVSKYALDDFIGGGIDLAREIHKKGWSGADSKKLEKAYTKMIVGAAGVTGVPGVDVSVGYGGGPEKAFATKGDDEIHATPSRSVKVPQKYLEANPKLPTEAPLSDADYETLIRANDLAIAAIKSMRTEADFKKLSPEAQKSKERAIYNRVVAPVRSKLASRTAAGIK